MRSSYKPRSLRILSLLGILAATSGALAVLPSFPGAEGFGATTPGGRGGTIIHVTTLADAGPGSLRDAVSQPHRIVVFDVAGVIRLASPLTLSDHLTVLGQTAPGDGVSLFGHGVSASGKSDVILRFLRLRSSIASSRGSKTLNIGAASNVIVDHCSVSWGRWDNLGITQSAHDVTIQDSIFSEAIDPQRFGALIDSSTNITVARTLWADDQSRNPKGKANLQYINNVVYNWGSTGYCGGHSGAVWNQDLLNNTFIAGPDSANHPALGQFTPTDHLFQSGNVLDPDHDGHANFRPVTQSDFRGAHADETPTFLDAASNHPAVPVTVLSAPDALEKVLSTVGCSLHRDPIDARIIDQVRSMGVKGAIIHDESAVGGINEISAATPPADSDHDGLPDAWESAHHLDPKDPADSAAIDASSGYANIELYANSLITTEPQR